MPQIPRNIQSPFTEADFWQQHDSTNPRFCNFIKVTPKPFWNVEPLAFTSNTRDMTLPGHPDIIFKSSPAISPTIIESALDEPPNLEVTGVYNSDSFTQTDVLAGKWEFAEIEVFVACWDDGLNGGIDKRNLGELLHFRGNIGEFKDYQTYFVCEARGLISRLSNDVSKVTQRMCRVKEFRDAECGHTADTVEINGNTYDVEQTGLIVIQPNPDGVDLDSTNWSGTFPPDDDDHVFDNGKITFTSGVNAGVSREIAGTFAIFPGLRIYVKREFPFQPEAGDTFDLVTGCDHTIENCMLYDNIVRRRAEDWIPDVEAANRIPPSN